jgi:hypothetical protein
MAKAGKGANRRAMPSTPPATPHPSDAATGDRTPTPAGRGPGPRPAEPTPAPDRGPSDGSPPVEPEPTYLVNGTGCTAGHERGRELDAGRIGRVPTKRATRIGFFLVLWCAIGVGLVVDLGWLSLGLQLLVLWLAFSAIVQRRSGHRGRCWRTRTWRHAWGGLAPTGSDPTRPAGT